MEISNGKKDSETFTGTKNSSKKSKEPSGNLNVPKKVLR